MKSTPKSGTPARAAAGRSGSGNRPTGGGGGGTTTRTANARATADFFRGIAQEMRRVTWPTRDEWVAATILTIALVVGVGFFTYFVDLLLSWVFSLLTGGPR